MNSRFDQLTKGLISLTVILMFAAALIADQARANLSAAVSAAPDASLATHLSIVLDKESLQKIESIPNVINTILALPIEIELTLRAVRDKNARSGESLAQ